MSLADSIEMERVRAALEKRRGGQSLTSREVSSIRRFEQKREEQQRRAVLSRVPQKDIIELFNRQTKTLLDWERDGLQVIREEGRVYYDLFVLIPWFERRLLGVDSGGSPGHGDMTKRAAEIKLLIRREAALQLKMQLLSGELIHRDEVERGRCERIKMVRTGMEALKRSLAPAVLELGDDATIEEVEALIWDYVEPLLKAFSGQRQK